MRIPFAKLAKKALGWLVKTGLDEAKKAAEAEMAKRRRDEPLQTSATRQPRPWDEPPGT